MSGRDTETKAALSTGREPFRLRKMRWSRMIGDHTQYCLSGTSQGC